MTGWKRVANDLVVKLMREHNLSAVALAENLKNVGFEVSAQGIRNKLGRGGFSAEFLLAVIGSIAEAQNRRGKTSKLAAVSLSGTELVDAYKRTLAKTEKEAEADLPAKGIEYIKEHGIPPDAPPATKRYLKQQLEQYEQEKKK